MACPPSLKNPCGGGVCVYACAYVCVHVYTTTLKQHTVSKETRVRMDGLVKIMARLFPANGLYD